MSLILDSDIKSPMNQEPFVNKLWKLIQIIFKKYIDFFFHLKRTNTNRNVTKRVYY